MFHPFLIFPLFSFIVFTGTDFSNRRTSFTIPANSQTYVIPQFFTIVDDNIDEDQQSFAIVAEIGSDVPDGVSCFQIATGDTDCHGRRGAVEIKITDNDRKFVVSLVSVEILIVFAF